MLLFITGRLFYSIFIVIVSIHKILLFIEKLKYQISTAGQSFHTSNVTVYRFVVDGSCAILAGFHTSNVTVYHWKTLLKQEKRQSFHTSNVTVYPKRP